MGVKRTEVKVWEGMEIGRVDMPGVGSLRTIELRIARLSLEELLVAMGKGETLFGESETECAGEGGKGLGESEL